MINKQSIWALSLFSLILVLSVYYITIPNELPVSKTKNNDVKVEKIDNNSTIQTLKVEKKEELDKKSDELKKILTDKNKTQEEKNNAYEELKLLNVLKGKEDEIELYIKDKYKLNNYVKINNDQVRVVIIKKEKNDKLAAQLMDTVQSYFNEKMYISVKFDN